jgi:hypothetical protein
MERRLRDQSRPGLGPLLGGPALPSAYKREAVASRRRLKANPSKIEIIKTGCHDDPPGSSKPMKRADQRSQIMQVS